MSAADRSVLIRLRDSGPEGVPLSQIPASCMTTINALLTCGAVRKSRSGRGTKVTVVATEAFERFCVAQFPLGLDLSDDIPEDRAEAVLLRGDAKAVRRGRGEGVLVRAVKPGITVDDAIKHAPVEVTTLTAASGAAALLLDDEHRWSFAGTAALIKNAEAFWRYERVLPDIDLGVYSPGMASNRLSAWLASDLMKNCSYIHWGDYDPVDTCEYLRLLRACPGRVRLHLPPIVDELLPKHGKRSLVESQCRALTELRSVTDDASVAHLVRLFDLHGRGLEQEILLNV